MEIKSQLPEFNDTAACRLAYICLLLDEFDLAAELLESTARQALMVDLFDEWPAGVDGALDAFNAFNMNELTIRQQTPLRMMVYAFGFHPEAVTDGRKERLVEQLTELFESKKTTAPCHSVAMWCLREFGESPTSAKEYRAGNGWMEVGDGLTLIEIPAGEIEHFGERRQVNPFLCGNSEVNEKLFELFEQSTNLRRGEVREISGISKNLHSQNSATIEVTEIRNLSPIYIPPGSEKEADNTPENPTPDQSLFQDGSKTRQIEVQNKPLALPASSPPVNPYADGLQNPFEIDNGDLNKLDPFSSDNSTGPKRLPKQFGKKKGSIDSRAGSVSYPLSLEFCNWLSRRHGLRPAYKKETHELGDSQADGGAKEWYLNVTADGYRLPTADEFDILKSSVGFPELFKSFPNVTGRFAYIGDSRINVAPDSRGLFDVIGSYWEWCEPYENGTVYENASKVLMGGSWRLETVEEAYRQRLVRPAESTFRDFGFRLVRSANVTFDENLWRRVYSNNPGWQNAVLFAEAEEANTQLPSKRIDKELDGIRDVVRFALDEGSFPTARAKLVETLKQIISDARLNSEVERVFGNDSSGTDKATSVVYWRSLELAVKEHYANLEEKQNVVAGYRAGLDQLRDVLDVENRSAESYRHAIEACFPILSANSQVNEQTAKQLLDAIRGYLLTRQTRASYLSTMGNWRITESEMRGGSRSRTEELHARSAVHAAHRKYLLAEYRYELAMKILFPEDASK